MSILTNNGKVQTPLRSDISASAQALFRFFNSINIHLPSDDRISMLTERITTYWISEYVNWYKNMSSTFTSTRLPSGFPILNVTGKRILTHSDAIENILNCGRDAGFILSLNLTVDDCEANKKFFNTLCNKKIIGHLHISISIENKSDFILKLVELAELDNFYLTLNIPLELAQSQLFFSEQLAGQNIQIIVDNSKIYDGELNVFSEFYITPCIQHFIIFIDNDGDIFPCKGLVGIQQANLGSIYSNFSDTAFVNKHVSLNLEQLALSGPDIQGRHSINKFSDSKLPKMCELHLHKELFLK